MSSELKEVVMLERVELIARLTTEGICRERDREIALDLIAELSKGNVINKDNFFTSSRRLLRDETITSQPVKNNI